MATTRPNILFFFPDQHRGDWTGYRNQPGVRTPNLDRLAASGQIFTNALTPSPVCSPARACLAAAAPYDAQPVRHNQHDVDPGHPNIYHALRRAGYQVLGCGKFDLLKMSMDWGESGLHDAEGESRLEALGFTRGIDNAGKHDFVTGYRRGAGEPFQAFLREQGLLDMHLEDYAGRAYGDGRNYTNVAPTPLPDFAYGDNWIADNGLRLLDGVGEGEPWFLQVNFNGPHEPMDVTAAMQARWRDVTLAPPVGPTDLDAEHHQAIRANYAAMIENIDRHLGRYLEYLDRRGWLDDTVVIYASDHGEMLCDHGHWGKVVPYQPSVHVPLVIAGAGIEALAPSKAWVDLVDVAETMVALAGAERVANHGAVLTRGEVADYKIIGLGRWRAIFDGNLKYVHNFEPAMKGRNVAGSFDDDIEAPHLLFDLDADPAERIDLASAHPDEAARLRDMLLDRIAPLRGR